MHFWRGGCLAVRSVELSAADRPWPFSTRCFCVRAYMNRRTMLGRLLGTTATMKLYASSASDRIEVGGSTLDVSIDSDQFELGRTALLDWVTRSAKAVTAYFGRFPVAHARVHITVSQHGGVSNGVSFGDGGAHCRISVGQHARLA